MTHVLLTNDDGFDAVGLRTARDALLQAGIAVTVVAPDGNRSGRGRAVTCHGTVSVNRVGGEDDSPIYSCDGSPVDCVRVGVLSDEFAAPDAVVSGINHGVNMGDDATYSGTLGAAIEGAMLSCPAISFSQQDTATDLSMVSSGSHRFDLAVIVPTLVRALVATPWVPRAVANVNFPNALRQRRIEVTRLGTFTYAGRWMHPQQSHGGGWSFSPYLGPSDPNPTFEDSEATDTGSLMRGRISLTPLSLNWARPPERDELRGWATSLARAGDVALSKVDLVDVNDRT